MPKWVYPLAFLFVLFLIYSEPNSAGETASAFASFVVELLGSVGEFLTGLFEGASDGGTSGTGPATSVAVADNAPAATGDSFTHSHGGLGSHSHGTTGN